MWRATEIGGWQCDKCGDAVILFAETDGNYCPKCGAHHGCKIESQKWKVNLCMRKAPHTTKTEYMFAKTKNELDEMMSGKEYYVSSASAVVSWLDFKESLTDKNKMQGQED